MRTRLKHDDGAYRIIQHSRNGESFDASHNPDDRPAGDMRLHCAEPRVRNLRCADRHHDLPSSVRDQGARHWCNRIPRTSDFRSRYRAQAAREVVGHEHRSLLKKTDYADLKGSGAEKNLSPQARLIALIHSHTVSYPF